MISSNSGRIVVYLVFVPLNQFGCFTLMTMTNYEMARLLLQLEETPEKVMFGKMLGELGQQSSQRIRSAAKQVPLDTLRDLIYHFQQVIEERKDEEVSSLAKSLAEQGISAEELKKYLESR